jgi:hypothetical protein
VTADHNLDCPRCYPGFLVPGTCHPCVIIRWYSVCGARCRQQQDSSDSWRYTRFIQKYSGLTL